MGGKPLQGLNALHDVEEPTVEQKPGKWFFPGTESQSPRTLAVSVVSGVSSHDAIVILQSTDPIMRHAPYLEGLLLKRNNAVFRFDLITDSYEWVRVASRKPGVLRCATGWRRLWVIMTTAIVDIDMMFVMFALMQRGRPTRCAQAAVDGGGCSPRARL